jgi:hypothetical protein
MKFVVVVNRKFDLAAQFNAAGHVCLGLPSLISESDIRLRRFQDQPGRQLSVLTDHPLIILSARNGEHIREAHLLAEQAGIVSNAFFDRMRSGTPEEQQTQIRSAPAETQEYVALALFGSDEKLRHLTRRFSLFRIL